MKRLALLAGLVAARPASAQECVEHADVVLYMAIDVSGSMSGTGQVAASDFGVSLIDALNATGHLERVGNFYFCDVIPAENLITTNISVVRNDIALLASYDLTSLPCSNTYVYDAIVLGEDVIDNQSSSMTRLYVVLTDGADGGSAHTPNQAASALASSGVTSHLIFAGTGSGASALASIASTAQSLGADAQADSTSFSALSGLVDDVVARACRNHSPVAQFTMSDSSLDLGTEGFQVSFDASGSSDQEDPDSALGFSWTLTRPGGGTVSASGISFSRTFSDADIGTWSIQLRVTDTDGVARTRTRSLDINGWTPAITVTGTNEIDALQELRITASPEEDVDGGGPMVFTWQIVEAPPRSSWQPPGPPTPITGHVLSKITDELDITNYTGGVLGTWRFRVTARDNESQVSPPQDFTVLVKNLPPPMDLHGPERIEYGETASAQTYGLEDPDGPFAPAPSEMSFAWDLVQVPGSAGLVPTPDYASGPELVLPTTFVDAGTWIFTLRVTDNEGETVEDDYKVLVNAPPEAIITGPDTGIVETQVTLSGADSWDPDSPDCPGDPDHCHLTDGPPAEVSPGITRRTWSLIEVPPQHLDDYSRGPVADTLGVSGSGVDLVLPAGTLEEGLWIFQLEVEDDEGGTHHTTHAIEMGHANTYPFAIVGWPTYHLTDSSDALVGPVVLDGQLSFDLDDILSGASYSPGLGITSFEWEPDRMPALCTLGVGGTSAATFPFLSAGQVIPAGCFGAWAMGLTVTDNDSPALVGHNRQWFFLSDCDGLVCIDHPTTDDKVKIAFSNNTDVQIAYSLNSAIYDSPFCAFGCYARLEIFHESDLGTPVFTANEPNPLGTDLGAQHFFKWNGYITDPIGGAKIRPFPGEYTVKVEVLDYAFSPSDPLVWSDTEPASILVETSEIAIDPSADQYLSRNAAVDGTDEVVVPYSVTGGVPITEVNLLVYEQGEPLPIWEQPQTVGAADARWSGWLGPGMWVEPGHYEMEVELVGAPGVLDTSARLPLTVYEIDLSLDGVDEADEDSPGAYLLVGDDTHAGEVHLLPDGLPGSLVLQEDGTNLLVAVAPGGDLAVGVDIPAGTALIGAPIGFQVSDRSSLPIVLGARYLPPGADTSKTAEDSVSINAVDFDLTAPCSDDALEDTDGIFVQRRGTAGVPTWDERFGMRAIHLTSSLEIDGVVVEWDTPGPAHVLAMTAPGGTPVPITLPWTVPTGLFDPGTGYLELDLYVMGADYGEGTLKARLVQGTSTLVEDSVKLRIGDLPQIVGSVLPDFPHWRTRRVYNTGEAVEVAVDPVVHTERRGKEARVYVVKHRTQAQWLADQSLADVSGGAEAFTLPAAPAGILDPASQASVWAAAALPTPSEQAHDVVIDYGGCEDPPTFGTLDPEDLLFRAQPTEEPAFVVLPDLSAAGPFATAFFEYGDDFEDGAAGTICTPMEDAAGAACLATCPFDGVCVDNSPADGTSHCTAVDPAVGCAAGEVCVNTDNDEVAHCRPAPTRIPIPNGYDNLGGEEQDCANGLDDDGDGDADCADIDCLMTLPACAPPPAEDCTNGIDDNGNGLVDCAELTCLHTCWPGFRLRGRVEYPSPLPAGTHPLVVIAHGNHTPRIIRDPLLGQRWRDAPAAVTSDHNYRGYTYLQQHLASHGMITVSIDLDEASGAIRAGYLHLPRGINVRAWILLKTIEQILADPTVGAAIDPNQIHLVGHSRGGEAVLAAREILSDVAAHGPPGGAIAGFTEASIQSIVSVSPTSFNMPALGTQPYLLVYGTADGDVNGSSSIVAPYRHLEAAPEHHVGVTVQGANHNFFNTSWASDDADATGLHPAGANLLERGTQEQLLEPYGLAWYRAFAGRPGYEALFDEDPTVIRPLGVPLTYVPHGAAAAIPLPLLQQRNRPPGTVERIDDYQTNPTDVLASSGAAVATGGSMTVFEDVLFDADLADEATQPNRFFGSTRGARLAWSGAGTLTWTPTMPVDLRPWRALHFRIARQPNQPDAAQVGPLVLQITLEDAGGDTATIRSDYHGPVAEEYRSIVPSDLSDSTGAAFQSIRIPIDRFAVAGHVIDLSQVAHIRLEVANVGFTDPGRIGFDDLELEPW